MLRFHSVICNNTVHVVFFYTYVSKHCKERRSCVVHNTKVDGNRILKWIVVLVAELQLCRSTLITDIMCFGAVLMVTQGKL